MRSISKVCVLLAVFTALALAESYTGKLVDSKCASENKTAACNPTSSTTSYTLNTSDKQYKLDAAGNAKASAALKSRADRSKDPNAKADDAPIVVIIVGTPDGDIIQVETITVQ